MVDKLQVDNPANKQMHYGQTSVGILTPPDRLPKVLVYSGIEAQNDMMTCNMIYTFQKRKLKNMKKEVSRLF